MKTVLEVLQTTTVYFQGKGVESARLNIEHLLAHVLGKTRMELYLEFDRPLGDLELGPLRELVKRRSQGEPLQHLLGTVEFHGRTFAVDARALIPRPETEQLVELILKLDLPAEPRCVDVGCGTGVIGLTLAAERPEARVDLVDCSPPALTLARENAARLGLAERVRFIEGDLLARAEGPYDVIAANLPYIASADLAGLSREVRRDPALALDGGPDGLALVARCIAEGWERLAPGGRLVLEIGHDQAERVQELLARQGYAGSGTAVDYTGVERFAFGTRPAGS